MVTDPKKDSLRRILLKRRDSTSVDFIKIASSQIRKNLNQIPDFCQAQRIAFYYPIGSEVLTQEIIQDALMQGKEISLPRIDNKTMIFKVVSDLGDLEKGKFDIMEPRDTLPDAELIDVVLVPAVAISRDGYRLGYGYGYYDRFLKNKELTSIALVFSKQIVRNVPHNENDIKIKWIVTEDEYFQTSEDG